MCNPVFTHDICKYLILNKLNIKHDNKSASFNRTFEHAIQFWTEKKTHSREAG